ncbi:MAG: iron-containing alcohol dehydrogenase, partial [Dehalococcoidia bacterium]|nr:iron-containing alcohol dehydrogenase [Dehalococcoidia bacterium]
TISQPDDLEARVQCQVAACLSISGVVNVRLGLSHAFGHQIGAYGNVAHGATSCIMLPHVMRFVAPMAASQMARMATAMGLDTGGMSDESAAAAAVDAVESLVRELGLPRRLRDVGVRQEDLKAIAGASFPEAAGSNSPRPVSNPDEVLQLLQKAW